MRYPQVWSTRLILEDLTDPLFLVAWNQPARWYNLSSLEVLDYSVFYGIHDIKFLESLIRDILDVSPNLDVCCSLPPHNGGCRVLRRYIHRRQAVQIAKMLTLVVANHPATALPPISSKCCHQSGSSSSSTRTLILSPCCGTPQSSLVELVIGRHPL